MRLHWHKILLVYDRHVLFISVLYLYESYASFEDA